MATEEQILLKSFLEKRADWEKYAPYILALKNLDRNVKLFLGFIKDFYDKYPNSDSIPESEFRIYLSTNDIYNFAQNNDQYVKDVFDTCTKNQDLKMDIIEASLEKHFASQMLDKISLIVDNGKAGVLSDCQQIIDDYHDLLRKPPQDVVEYSLDLQKLIDEEVIQNGAPFVNTTPNDLIRGMRVGQLGLIAAYVGTGKTSYGVANLCSVANYLRTTNSNRPVIYGCNEESVHRVTLRAVQCMTGWSGDEIAKNIKAVPAILKAKGFDTIKFVDNVTDIKIVEKLLVKNAPRVMFLDLGTKVRLPYTKLEGVDALERVFNTLRELAKRYDTTIVCMAQGGDSAFQKKYPTLRDIYGSRSAIQGELDWAISIGVDVSDTKYINYRYFSITKNKGKEGTYACRFDPDRCQFKEVT